jgi:hypothetical protein
VTVLRSETYRHTLKTQPESSQKTELICSLHHRQSTLHGRECDLRHAGRKRPTPDEFRRSWRRFVTAWNRPKAGLGAHCAVRLTLGDIEAVGFGGDGSSLSHILGDSAIAHRSPG